MIRTLRLGDFEFHSLDAGKIRYDGGVTFGAVPKSAWSKLATPDAQNRVTLAMRPVVIRGRGTTILVDAGFGDHQHPRLREMYALEGSGRIEDALLDAEIDPGEIDVVLFTHLHVDHAGGAFERREGTVRPALPGAKYVLQSGEREAARRPSLLTRAGYSREDMAALGSHGDLEAIEGDGEIADGVRVQVSGGHTAHHQMVFVDTGEGTVWLPGDIVPSLYHIRPPYITGTDLDRMTTFLEKNRCLQRAGVERWHVLLYHEPNTPLGRVAEVSTGRYELSAPSGDEEDR